MSVAVLSDGRIVSGSQDKTLRIWNLNTGACDMVLEGPEGVSRVCMTCIAVVRIGCIYMYTITQLTRSTELPCYIHDIGNLVCSCIARRTHRQWVQG